MNTLDRYITKCILQAVFIAFLIVTAIIMLVDFVEASRNMSADTDLTSLGLAWLTMLRTPQLIEQTIPFVILFGVMGGLYSLNKRSELTVMRACGLSAWRFLRPVIIATGLIGILWSLAFNPFASKAMELHTQLISKYTDSLPAADSQKPIWLREGNEHQQTVIYAKKSDIYKRKLYDVTFTMFEADANGDFVFNQRFDAKEATLLPSNYWQLKDIIENTHDAITRRNASASWPTTITIQQLQNYNKRSSLPAFWELPAEIKKLSQAGFSNKSLRMQFNKLLSLPLTLIAMSIIAAAVSMQMTRQGGTLRLMLIGGVVGFAVFFTDNMIGAFGESGAIPVVFSVWITPFFVLLCSMAYLSKIEDG